MEVAAGWSIVGRKESAFEVIAEALTAGVPVLAGSESERVADPIQHTRLNDRSWPGAGDRVRQSLAPVTHDDARVSGTAVA